MDEKTGLISRSDPTENLSDENSVILGTSNECKAPKSISSSDKRNNRIFEKEEDWALFAYCVFEAPGAVLYFFQAVLPFYSFPQLLREEELGDLDAWIGVVAGGIFVLVSFVYLKAWQVGRKNKKRSLPNGKKGWDFLANILFLIGSVGYQLTSIADLGNVHIMEARALDLLLAVLFVFDSTFYLLALFENKPRKEPTKQKSSVDRSSLDFYLLGTLLFIFGSYIYLGAAIQDLCDIDSSFLYLLGGLVFLLDAPLYIISAYQATEESNEVFILERKNIFLLETVV